MHTRRWWAAAGVGALLALSAGAGLPGAAPAAHATVTTIVDPAATVDTTVAAEGAATTTTAPASTTTSTTLAPERCDPVAPKAFVFVGTATVKADDSVTFRVDEVREGPSITGQTVVVTFVRDARFFKIDERYLVTAALDPDAQLYVSKVRPRRGEDPRCVAKDPVYTTLANGTPIDTGVFSGLSGTSGKVYRAFLLPLAGVVGLLLALVLVKRLVVLTGRGIARLIRGPAPRAPS